MIQKVITLLLGPILLLQGRSVRKNIPRLQEPEGARSGIAGGGYPVRILILGDSAASGVGVGHQDQALAGGLQNALKDQFRIEWKVVARTGATTRFTIDSLASVPDETFDVVATSLGVNDIIASVGLKSWLSQQRHLRDVLRQRFNPSLLIISGFPPVSKFPALPQPLRWYLGRRAREFDKAIEIDLRRELDCVYLPIKFEADASMMALDGFHPGPIIYRKWAESIARVVSDQMNERTRVAT